MNAISIEYENGQMEIYLNNFFPCPKTKMKMILDIISRDKNRAEKYKEIANHLTDKILQIKEDYCQKANESRSLWDETVKYQKMIYDRQDGQPIINIEEKQKLAKQYMSAFKKSLQEEEKIKSELEKYQICLDMTNNAITKSQSQ